MIADRLKELQNPPSSKRGAVFWAWNGELSSEELVRQIKIFQQMGLGGFFMHSRVGLKTEYLGEQWFEYVRTCLNTARELGLNAWIYDEDRWPSGAAGGLVTQDDRYKMRSLHLEVLQSYATPPNSKHSVALFRAELDQEKGLLLNFRRTASPEKEVLDGKCVLLHCYEQLQGKSSWFNGETYLDTLNPEAVAKFLSTTHEEYSKRFADDFGTIIPGIFTDEPNYNSTHNSLAFPWTAALPSIFQEEYHEELTARLPLLFFSGIPEETRKFRWQFFNLLTKQFVHAFAQQIGEWCQKHHCSLTGHVLCEDTMEAQTVCSGSAMRFYEYMQQPGIDLLTEHWNIFLTTKQCVSVARQLGKERRLSELYGCTGWDFPLLGHKALGDWQYALGINFRCLHLSLYTLEGEAKRDCPASISYQSPWYLQYKQVEDYFARLGTILIGNQEIRDLLLIHPLESCWCNHQTSPDWDLLKRGPQDKDLAALVNELLAQKLDFDFGDELLMAKYGSAEEKRLIIGEAQYRAVLIPELTTIRSTTLELLEKFAESGGITAYFGAPPPLVNGEPNLRAAAIYKKLFTPVTKENFVEILSPGARRISLTDDRGSSLRPLLYHLSKGKDFYSLFLCNFGKEFAEDFFQEVLIRDRNAEFPIVHVALKIPECGQVFEIDPQTGNCHPVPSIWQDGKYQFDTSLYKLESRLFVISRSQLPTSPAKPVTRRTPSSSLRLDGNWNYRLDSPNVLLLDHPAAWIKNGKEFPPTFVLHLDQALRAELGKPPRGEIMIQPWKCKKENPEKTLDLRLLYEFQCNCLSEQALLGLETPENCNIVLNSHPLSSSLFTSDWWTDPAIRTFPVASLLKPGKNTLEIFMKYHEYLPGLEAIYLLGNFGVYGESLHPLPENIHTGDWCLQGLPHYAGNLVMEKELPVLPEGNVQLEIPEWRGAALAIQVNDSPEIFLAWDPFTAELSPYLKRDGKDRLKITVFGHLRNAFGPFYMAEKWPMWIGSRSFILNQVTERQLVPCGLLQAPVLNLS